MDMYFNCLEKEISNRFGDLLEAAPDAIIITDDEGRILLANSHAERLFRFPKKELASLAVEDLLPARFRSKHCSHRRHYTTAHAVARPMGSGNRDLWGVRADGTEFPVDISLSPLHVGDRILVVAAIRDMTVRQLAEDKLREMSAELERNRAGLQAILDSLDEGVIVLSLEGEVLDLNPAALRMHGFTTLDEAKIRVRDYSGEFHACRPGGELITVENWPVNRIALGETVTNVELEVWTLASARRGIYSYSGTPVLDENGNRVLSVCTVRDITEQKESQERIRQAGLHDALTGLPNRALLAEYSRHVFARTRRSRSNAAVLFIDLDRFKPINDSYGHEAGDAMLQAVAARIRQTIRQEDVAFRLGGDEFLVILPEIEDASRAAEVGRHLSAAICQPLPFSDVELSVSTSIGISVYPRDSENIDDLINQADLAMYHVKYSGKNRCHFYSTALAERVSAQSLLEEQLKTALDENQFALYYQPVIDLASGLVASVEALLRWPNDGGPDRFIPVAEATGLIGRLGKWVIVEACRQHKRWIQHGLPPIPIAVNVSAIQFRQSDLAGLVRNAIDNCCIDGRALQLELTETALMEDIERAIQQLADMKSLGIKIALDDFGTGYSSLAYLSRLPIDKIKVDKSFVFQIESDPVCRSITDAIIALGRTLNLEVVAEGIESRSVLHYLQDHGCNQVQGFHLCEPVDAGTFEDWYRHREGRPILQMHRP